MFVEGGYMSFTCTHTLLPKHGTHPPWYSPTHTTTMNTHHQHHHPRPPTTLTPTSLTSAEVLIAEARDANARVLLVSSR